MKKRVVRAMGLHPNTPVDILFRGAESDLDVIHNIQKLLNRADYLTKTYGMPGYSKEVKNDFQKIKEFISSIDVEKQSFRNLQRISCCGRGCRACRNICTDLRGLYPIAWDYGAM